MSAPAIREEQTGDVIRLNDAESIMQMIVQAAKDPSVDLDRVERLWAMKVSIERDQAERAFNEAMARCQAEMPQVVRDAENSHTSSRYARLETISAAITPVYTRHGFSLTFSPAASQKDGWLRLSYRLSHIAGFERTDAEDFALDGAGSQGKANKTPIQAWGSTVSYARRYLTLMIFNIALKNEDTDGNKPPAPREFVSAEQVDRLRKALQFRGKDEQRFCRSSKIKDLSDIYADRFEDALRAINAEAVR